MTTSDTRSDELDRAAKARIETIRSLSLIRETGAPAPAPRRSRLVHGLIGLLILQSALMAYFLVLRPGAAAPSGAAAPAAGGAVAGPVNTSAGAGTRAGPDAGVRLQAQGFVFATRQATVSTRVPGIVTRVPVKVGDHVEQGQIVGVLNSDLAQQDLNLAEKELVSLQAMLARERARQDQAEKEYQRELLLEKSQFSSPARVDERKAASIVARTTVAGTLAQLGVGEVRVRQQREMLSNYTIRAPFSGIVVETNAQVGELVAPMGAGGSFTRTGICTIVDMDSLIIVVDIGEQQLAHVKVGQAVTFHLYLDQQTQMNGVVQRILPSADRAKGTVQAHIAITAKDPRALPGMRANVNFI